MQIEIDKNNFSNSFLAPINKISDNGILEIKKDCVECVSTSSFDKKDQTIILYSRYESEFDLAEGVESIKLNIPDIKRLITALSFIECEDETNVKINIDTNSISYKAKDGQTSFKYHLLEDGVIPPASVKIENVYKLGFDFEADLSKKTFKQILKGSTYADQTNKIYLYTKDENFFGILTDESLQNVDMVEIKLSEEYNGNGITNKIPISLEIFRVISTLGFDSIKLKVNTQKDILMFEINKLNFKLQYIVTALIK